MISNRHVPGSLADGRVVTPLTLRSASGHSARILTYGAALQSYTTSDRAGNFEDILLGFETVEAYENHQFYMGATVGRYANRIAGGRFSLDGQDYALDGLGGAATLHGGAESLERQIWEVEATSVETSSITLRHDSPDGASGFPGAVTAHATYTLDAQGHLIIDYSATSDRPTVIAMTNHAYYNLQGQTGTDLATAMRMFLPAEKFLPTDRHQIPTGEISEVANTGFDFRKGRIIADALMTQHSQLALCGGIDHTFLVEHTPLRALRLMARLEHVATGRALYLLSTEPVLYVYSGNDLDGTLAGKSGKLYRRGEGVALKPKKLPDTPKQPSFGSARLDPGDVYRHQIVLRPTTI